MFEKGDKVFVSATRVMSYNGKEGVISKVWSRAEVHRRLGEEETRSVVDVRFNDAPHADHSWWANELELLDSEE